MNGQDFLEDTSTAEFTFVGTAPYISFVTVLMVILAFGFVVVSFALCTMQVYSSGNGQIQDIMQWGAQGSRFGNRAGHNQQLRNAPNDFS